VTFSADTAFCIAQEPQKMLDLVARVDLLLDDGDCLRKRETRTVESYMPA